MTVIGSMLALAAGFAARLRPEANADVEITKLREELATVRLQVDVMRIALMEAQRERDLCREIANRTPPVILYEPPDPRLREIVDCTGGGRYAHLTGAAQQMAAQQQAMAAYNAQQAACAQQAMAAQYYPFQTLGQLGQGLLGGLSPCSGGSNSGP